MKDGWLTAKVKTGVRLWVCPARCASRRGSSRRWRLYSHGKRKSETYRRQHGSRTGWHQPLPKFGRQRRL